MSLEVREEEAEKMPAAEDGVEEEPREMRVEEEPREMRRAEPVTPVYSYILIACIVSVWLVQILFAAEESALWGGEFSVAAAGFVKPLFLEGQYWRILTAGTIHGGILHLAFNSYALYILGKLMELLSNRAHLAIVFVLSVIGGGLMSLFFLPDADSIGASGGIVGFLGYLTAYGYKRREILSNAFLKNMLFNIAFIAFVGIFVIPNVDNFGHLGGLLVGLVYGFIQIPSDLYKDPREAAPATVNAGRAALVLFILTSFFSVLLLTGIVSFPSNLQ